MTETKLPPHRVMREVLRNYLIFKQYSAQTGNYVIEHDNLIISFLDLQDKLRQLSPRMKEAVFLNVILDKKQREVATIMGITTVSVGQYVDGAMLKLAKDYFTTEELEDYAGKPEGSRFGFRDGVGSRGSGTTADKSGTRGSSRRTPKNTREGDRPEDGKDKRVEGGQSDTVRRTPLLS